LPAMRFEGSFLFALYTVNFTGQRRPCFDLLLYYYNLIVFV